MISCKRSIYTIVKRDRRYFFIRKRTPIPRTYFAYRYLKDLTNNSYRSMLMKCKYIRRDTPGIYAIFEKKKDKNRLNLGRCLYVGQTVHLKRRRKEHEAQLKEAKKHIKTDKPYYLRHLDYKYYKMAEMELSGKTLLFVCVKDFENKEWSQYSLEEALELLCLYEQHAIDVLRPKLNSIASRTTDMSRFKKQSSNS